MPLPQVPECSVSIGADGLIHLTHRRTRETATASTVEQVHIQAALLRISAAPWMAGAA